MMFLFDLAATINDWLSFWVKKKKIIIIMGPALKTFTRVVHSAFVLLCC